MNTIVLNTMNGAVTEYGNYQFQSITPTHAGDATGLFELAGETDNGQRIVARIETAASSWGTTLKKMLAMAYIGIKGKGQAQFTVREERASTPYVYPLPVLTSGVSRAKPGRGISENYLAFGLTKTDGLDFQLDRIEVEVNQSTQRRTK